MEDLEAWVVGTEQRLSDRQVRAFFTLASGAEEDPVAGLIEDLDLELTAVERERPPHDVDVVRRHRGQLGVLSLLEISLDGRAAGYHVAGVPPRRLLILS